MNDGPIMRCTCQPPSDPFFSRVLCGCGAMHEYCECGRNIDPCPLEVAWEAEDETAP
jgi:hypothetical protein